MKASLPTESRCSLHGDRATAETCERCGRFACRSCTNHLGVCWQCVARALERLESPAPLLTFAAVALCIDNFAGAFWTAVFGLIGQPETATQVLISVAGIIAYGLDVLLMGVVPAIFLRWLWRVASRASAIGVELPATRGWLIGAWLVPVANLVAGFVLLKRFARALAGRELLGPMVWAWQVVFAVSFFITWVPVILQSEAPPASRGVLLALRLFSSGCLFVAMRRIQRALENVEAALAAARPRLVETPAVGAAGAGTM